MSLQDARPVSSKVGVVTLTAMVVGTMVGGGVFNLPALFAEETGVVGTLSAWAIAGFGMLTLAFVFQRLAVRKPALDSGIYAYAKAGFGEYAGFLSAVGYWAGACAALAFFWILIMSTLGQVFPELGEGDTVWAIVASTVLLWVVHLLIRRGMKEAASLNRVVTAAKIVPILVFLVICAVLLDPQVFVDNLWADGADVGAFGDQIRGTMLATVFVFLGVEAASIFSRHARTRKDVGRATVYGFLGVLAVFASVTVVSYGILPRAEIAALAQPSMAGILQAAVGGWGAVLVSVGLVVSVVGAYIALSIAAGETLFAAAKDRDLPRFLARANARDVPVPAMFLTTALVQVVLVVTLFSADALDFALELTAGLTLIPFLFVAAYALRLRLTGETYEGASRSVRRTDLVIAVIAVIYTLGLIVAAGLTYVLLSCVVFVPATILFVMTRREQQRRIFSATERVVFALVVVGAVAGVQGLAAGWITI
nr:basic amino acid/polyamine antiporter [Paraoerskovia sediminicola]